MDEEERVEGVGEGKVENGGDKGRGEEEGVEGRMKEGLKRRG